MQKQARWQAFKLELPLIEAVVRPARHTQHLVYLEMIKIIKNVLH